MNSQARSAAEARPLGTSALMLGAVPGCVYHTEQTILLRGSTIYMFSDGVFEVTTASSERWTVSDFVPWRFCNSVVARVCVDLWKVPRPFSGPKG